MKKAIRFKGYDWTELLQLKQVAGRKWPKLPKKLDNEHCMVSEDVEAAYLIKTYLEGFFCDDTRSKERKQVATVRHTYDRTLAYHDIFGLLHKYFL